MALCLEFTGLSTHTLCISSLRRTARRWKSAVRLGYERIVQVEPRIAASFSEAFVFLIVAVEGSEEQAMPKPHEAVETKSDDEGDEGQKRKRQNSCEDCWQSKRNQGDSKGQHEVAGDDFEWRSAFGHARLQFENQNWCLAGARQMNSLM
jgi:hypothetical protein